MPPRTAFRRVLGLVSGGAGLTSAEAARLFALFDEDSSGSLDFDEFCALVRDREVGDFTDEELRARGVGRGRVARLAKRKSVNVHQIFLYLRYHMPHFFVSSGFASAAMLCFEHYGANSREIF